MKHFSTLLLFAALFNSTSTFGQNNKATFGLFYLPINGNSVSHGSLGYYRTINGIHSIGMKAMITTDELGAAPTDGIRNAVLNIDLVHRWSYKSETKRSVFHLDAGLSICSWVKKVPSYQYMAECTMGVTEEQLLEAQKYAARSHTLATFQTGIATAANWEFVWSKHVGFGAGVIMNTYFSPKERFQFLPIPHVNVAYNF